VAAIRWQNRFCGIFFFFAVLVALTGAAGAENAVVDAVRVSVQAGAAPPPARVIKRMEQSVATVGEHVLAGRKVADVESNKAAYEKVIKEVFDRVLVGYSVQAVLVAPGPTTSITVRILPWGDIVRGVAVETDPGGIAPQILPLLRQDMGDVEQRVSQVLVGLPVDSVEWAGSLSKSVIREYLAAQLPEFRTNLEIVPGSTTTVKLSLVPAGPLVKDVRVTLRSRTIPNFLLLGARPTVEEAAVPMQGLPVAFVERHADHFKNMLLKVAAAHPATRRYGLELTADLKAGVDSELVITAETPQYNVSLEGYLDMGRKAHDTSARLHVGRNCGPKDELFLEVTFVPGSVSWEFVPGWGHRLGARTETGLKYSLSDAQAVLWLKQELSANWLLRLERVPASGANELGLRYKLHDFLSLEYVFTKNDNWLRLVGNL